MPLFVVAILIVTLVTALSVPSAASAQNEIENVFVVPDRQLRQRLDMAQDLLERKRYSEAVQVLTSVLEAKEDYLYQATGPTDNASGGRKLGSLKREARRMIGNLPPEAARAYELQFGDTARRRLNAALAAADLDAVADVSRQFPHTAAGQESLMLLGYSHMNRGRYLAAALCFQQVREAKSADEFEPGLSLMTWACWRLQDNEPQASESIQRLREKYGSETFEVGGVEYPIVKNGAINHELVEAIAQVRPEEQLHAIDWTIVGGNPTRTATSAGGRPLLIRPRWRQRISHDAATIDTVARARREFADQFIAAIPAAHPLALRDLIIMRSPQRLVAIDFKSGKRLWHIENLEPVDASAEASRTVLRGQPTNEESRIRRRLWKDRTFGMISSDGSAVFAIENIAGPENVGNEDDVELNSRPESPNELVAYDVAQSEGKRLWTVGGLHGVEPQLEGAYFLGPPLPLDGRLYTIVEQAGEIRLAVLGSGGRLLWTQQLAVVGSEIPYNRDRRLAGLSPSSAENVIVCPTGVGAIVAVDRTTRNLLWGYQYDRREIHDVDVRRPVFPGQFDGLPDQEEREIGSVSADDGVTLADGLVLVAPSDSDALHCVDLATGKPKWRNNHKRSTKADLYVATVYGNFAIVVSNNAVTAVSLGDGRRHDFPNLDLSADATPSGRGFRVDERYYLPLAGPNGGELIILDLEKREPVDRVSTGDGTTPGNLICYRGQIVSLGTEYLELYDDLDMLRRHVTAKLEQTPLDPWALTSLAETFAETEDHSQAIEKLRLARTQFEQLSRDTTERESQDEVDAGRLVARELLFKSLLAELRSDYAKNRSLANEIEPIISSNPEKIDYLHVVAEGRDRTGELAASLDAYLDLIDATRDDKSVVKMAADYSVRYAYWIRARLADLYSRLDAEPRQQLDARLQQSLAGIARNESSDRILDFLRYHGDHPLAIQARQMLFDNHSTDLDASDRIALLSALYRQGSPEQRRRAAANLALIYHDAGRPIEAAHYCRQLLDQWSDEIVAGNQAESNQKTGKEFVDSLPIHSTARNNAKMTTRQALDRSTAWPSGAVHVDRRVGGSYRQYAMPIKILSRSDLYPSGYTMEYVPQHHPQRLQIRDESGAVQWQAPLQQMASQYNIQSIPTARLVNNRLYLSVDRELLVLDRLEPTNGSSTIAWRTGNQEQRRQGRQRQRVQLSTRVLPRPWSDGDQRHIFLARRPQQALGPAVHGTVTHVQGNDLVARDTKTGSPVWIRHGLIRQGGAPYAELFGDESALILAYRDETNANVKKVGTAFESRAVVLRPVDGTTLVESARIPSPDRRWTTRGRHILEWRAGDGQTTLALFDPLEQSDAWTLDVDAGAKGTLLGEQQAVVMERSGRLRVIDIDSGNVLLERQLAPEPKLRGLYVFRDSQRYVVFVGQTAEGSSQRYRGRGQAENVAQFTGRVYALDLETGEPLWPRPATLGNQWLPLDQPHALPVVAFCHLSVDRLVTFSLLDKQTGALAASPVEIGLGQINGLVVEADIAKKQIQVSANSGRLGILAHFTDTPRPPAPPVQLVKLDDEPTLKKSFGNAMRFLGKAVGQDGKQKAEKKREPPAGDR